MRKYRWVQSRKIEKVTPCKHSPPENLCGYVTSGEIDIRTSNVTRDKGTLHHKRGQYLRNR